MMGSITFYEHEKSAKSFRIGVDTLETKFDRLVSGLTIVVLFLICLDLNHSMSYGDHGRIHAQNLYFREKKIKVF